MSDINVIFTDMPSKTKAYVVQADFDEYTIYLNTMNTYEQNITSYVHEMNHIRNGDYNKLVSVNIAELLNSK